jgi:hypothetical protein
MVVIFHVAALLRTEATDGCTNVVVVVLAKVAAASGPKGARHAALVS